MKTKYLIATLALTSSLLAFSSCTNELESISPSPEPAEQATATIGDGEVEVIDTE